MDFLSLVLLSISFALAFHSVRTGRAFWISVRDAVVATALFEVLISAGAVSLAISTYWPVIVEQVFRTALLAALTAVPGALLARFVPQRAPVTYW